MQSKEQLKHGSAQTSADIKFHAKIRLAASFRSSRVRAVCENYSVQITAGDKYLTIIN